MRRFVIYPIDEEHEIEVIGNYSVYMNALNKGIYKRFFFKVVDIPYHTRKYLLRNCNDFSSNRGRWYVHCNGFNMDIVWHYNKTLEVNTYREYRTNKSK